MSRLSGRLHLARRAAIRALLPRRAPGQPQRILVAHHFLLGDTMMLAALFARLRARHPQARIVTTVPAAFAPLFQTRPYGVEAWPYAPRDGANLRDLSRRADALGGFDLALVPGDNRYALLARALGSRWVRAFADDTPRWKNRLCDELIPWPAEPTNLADLLALLAGPDLGLRVCSGDWPPPAAAPVPLPAGPYAVLHLGARSPLRFWDAAGWASVARELAARGITPLWSAGAKEVALVQAADPEGRYPSLAGGLDLPQLWQVFAGARVLVCPDTGVAHLGKVVGVPTVCLFGPGSPQLYDGGAFWADAPFAAVGPADFPCRDQQDLFKRELSWVRRCHRGPAQCSEARCMRTITAEQVLAAIEQLLAST